MTVSRRGRATPFTLLLVLLALVVAAPPALASPHQVPAAAATSWVRAAHLVPGVGTMTIRLVPFAGSALKDIPAGSVPEAMADGTTRVLESGVGYGGIGDYRQVPAGLYAVTIRPKGSGTDGPPVLTGTFEAKAGRAVTLAALGGTKKDPRIATITDQLTPPVSGSAKVRLLPALPDATSMTVSAQGGPTIAKNAGYGTPTGYRTVPAGSWTLRVTTKGGSSGDPVTASVDVASGGIYTVFVLGDGDGGITLKAVSDAQGMGRSPRSGVQTGLGGLAERPADPLLLGGLGLAGAGALALVLIASRRRPVAHAR